MFFKEGKKVQGIWGVEVQFEAEHCSDDTNAGKEDAFTIVATENGVFFKGRSGFIHDVEDLDTLAKTLSLAWEQRMLLKPKLTVNERGH